MAAAVTAAWCVVDRGGLANGENDLMSISTMGGCSYPEMTQTTAYVATEPAHLYPSYQSMCIRSDVSGVLCCHANLNFSNCDEKQNYTVLKNWHEQKSLDTSMLEVTWALPGRPCHNF